MQIYDQLRQLIDVPPTFRRETLFYQQLMASLAAGLTLLTEASNAGLDQTNYQKAVAGWIDVWADLAGILRHSGEADSLFKARVPAMLLSPRDSIVAIRQWLRDIENLPTSIVIESPQIGYSVTVPGTLTPQRVADVAKNLAWVRPAGVPVDFSARSGGTYLNTVDYYGTTRYSTPLLIGSPASGYTPVLTDQGLPILISGRLPFQGARVTGSYLAFKYTAGGTLLPASTNNNVSQLPDLLLNDPTLNPNLATPLGSRQSTGTAGGGITSATPTVFSVPHSFTLDQSTLDGSDVLA